MEKENICPDHFPDFNLESSIIVILLLKMFIVKDLTDFRKTVETGVDPRLDLVDCCGVGLVWWSTLEVCLRKMVWSKYWKLKRREAELIVVNGSIRKKGIHAQEK